MKSAAKTVDEYIDSLPSDRQGAIKTVLKLVRENMPEGYEETMNWGMICWQVPLSVYPDTYNKQPFMYAALASQKNNMALYIMCPYMVPGDDEKFRAEYKATGKKLDMGKSCIRFKKLDDLPLDVIAKYIALIPMADFVAHAKSIHPKN